MKKRGRKKKVVTSTPQSENSSATDQDGPVLDLEKSIIKKLIRKGKKDGYLTNVAGDGLYYLVEWDASKKLKVEGVHQFGSATLDETSPHYADQAEDYALEILHDPWFSEAALQQNLQRAYRPGDDY